MCFLLALLLACAETSSPAIKSKQPVVTNSNWVESRAERQQAEKRELPFPIASSTPIRAESSSEETGKNNDYSQDRIYKVDVVTPERPPKDTPLFFPYLIATVAGVVVNAFILIVIWKQAKKTGIAADAALLNARAVINAERAWVKVTFEEISPGEFVFVATNHGRTPAKIVAENVKEGQGKDTQDVPATPKYPDTRYISPKLVVDGERSPIPFNFGVKYFMENADFAKEINTNQKRLLVWGEVKYLDTFNEPHHTRFCYWYNPLLKTLCPGGPEEYNEHT